MNAIHHRGGTSWRTSAPRSAGLIAGILLLAAGAAAEDKPKEDYSKLPGYVDFQGLGIFGEEDSVVEVYLHNALLHMVAQMSTFADPELADMLEKLKLIRVQKFRLEEGKLEAVDKQLSDLSGKLEKTGWMRVVRVREADENVYVYFKFGGEKVQGITIMAVEEHSGPAVEGVGRTAAFVNIVGEIDPAQIGRLGRKFDLHELDKIDLGKDADKPGRTKKSKKSEKPERPEAPEKPEAPESPDEPEGSPERP